MAVVEAGCSDNCDHSVCVPVERAPRARAVERCCQSWRPLWDLSTNGRLMCPPGPWPGL